MKKSILTLGITILFVVGSLAFTACKKAKKSDTKANQELQEHKKDDKHQAGLYQCPMKCEGNKTYEKKVKCPKCGMDVEKIAKKEHKHNGHSHTH